MRALGLDVGSRRIGVALSDELKITAQPFAVLDAKGDVVARIAALCEEHEVDTIVVGLPLSMGGGEKGASSVRAKELAARLKERVGAKIVLRDERFSTAEAERVLLLGDVRRDKRRAVVDKIAGRSSCRGTWMPGRRRGTGARAFALAAAVLVAVAACGAYELLVRFPSAPGPGRGAAVSVDVPRGVGPRQLAGILARAGVTASPIRFALWLRATREMPKVRAGRFALRDDMAPREILEIVARSDEGRGLRVTIPEGFDLGRTADAIAAAGISTREALLEAARDPALLRELGIPGPSAEGFLFPDTYFFFPGTTAKDALRRMHATFEAKLAALAPAPGTDLLATVTLASIAQAEAKVADELPTIAGVYRNRLARPDFPSHLLQADPTVAYSCAPFLAPKAPSCAGFAGALGRRQLDDPENPYNTYARAGLPPGPICAPGAAALAAALHPAAVPYLYFVAGPNGRHRFSATLEEHEKAVELYRKGL